jgi:dihydropyrimidinase
LRDKSNWPLLWEGLRNGDLQVVSTDHCPFNYRGQKDMGKKDFAAIPNGAPGIEHRLQLIFHEGVNKKRISLNKMVDILATSPAKIFGLAPQKGSLAVGSDADLVVFDPKAPFTITARRQQMNVDYTPYEGFKGKGKVRTVLCRGRVIVENNKFLGQPGHGLFLTRKPFKI